MCDHELDRSGAKGPQTKDVPMTRRQPPEARRQQILDAAAALLLEAGLAGTSVEAVARRAGIAKGTVYLYFPSWQDLLGALRARYAHGLAGRAEAVFGRADPADPGSVVGAFDRLAGELLSYVQVNRRLYHILFQEAGRHEEHPMGQLHHLVCCLLTEAMDQGALTPIDPELLTRFLLDGLHAALLPLAHQDQPDHQRALTGLSQLLRRLLSPATHQGAS
jgi:AcrR family transcriptional regulator